MENKSNMKEIKMVIKLDNNKVMQDLKESVIRNTSIVEYGHSLKKDKVGEEIKELYEINNKLQIALEEKSEELIRVESNIKSIREAIEYNQEKLNGLRVRRKMEGFIANIIKDVKPDELL